MEVQLVSPCKYPLTVFTLVFVSSGEMYRLKEGII